jgi:hypothetical protein
MQPYRNPEDPTVYVLGYWGNPYRANDNEYYWMRVEEGMHEARAAGKRKQDRGQPTQFTNWVKGKNQFFRDLGKFVAAAQKVGLNPRLTDEEKAQLA